MTDSGRPTLPEILRGYGEFNEWEEAERQNRLPDLSVEEALRQFVELCDLVCHWKPENAMQLQLLEEERSGWIELLNSYFKQREGAGDESTAGSRKRDPGVPAAPRDSISG